MTKIKFIVFGIISVIFLHGCNKILEPVSLFVSPENFKNESVQEEFDINIKNLTFESAREANKSPYPRQIMKAGIGSKANVFDEAYYLSSNIPPKSSAKDYMMMLRVVSIAIRQTPIGKHRILRK